MRRDMRRQENRDIVKIPMVISFTGGKTALYKRCVIKFHNIEPFHGSIFRSPLLHKCSRHFFDKMSGILSLLGDQVGRRLGETVHEFGMGIGSLQSKRVHSCSPARLIVDLLDIGREK